jgi:hypothetical protein
VTSRSSVRKYGSALVQRKSLAEEVVVVGRSEVRHRNRISFCSIGKQCRTGIQSSIDMAGGVALFYYLRKNRLKTRIDKASYHNCHINARIGP